MALPPAAVVPPLLCFFTCPPRCVCQEHSVSVPGEGGGVGGAQQDALTRCGRDNHGGYGLPRLASLSFSSFIPCLIFPSTSSSSTRSFYVYLLPSSISVSLRATLALITSPTSANASAFIYFIFLSTPRR